jgi:hypothetical protein
MSRQLVSHSPDLQRLQDEGYDFEIRDSHLLVRVPYITADRAVAIGILASGLTTSGDRTAAPGSHVVYFIGSNNDMPHDDHGNRLDKLINQPSPIQLCSGLWASCSFSHKPDPMYADYYEKMSTYADMLLAYAQAVDPSAKVKTFPPIATGEDESVFRYLDSATSRARIGAVTEKIRLGKVVIIGLGGSGSYILDAVSKTPVREIHLYDKDILLTHNAFRAPGAASLADLTTAPRKVDYFQRIYDAMRRGIMPHAVHIDASNIDELRDAQFVFIAIDAGPGKRFIVQKLHEFGIPFIDTGMGIYQAGDSLGGMIRTTTSAPGNAQHIWDNARISFGEEEVDEYEQNIQIVELNMLNAALAVIKWKKLFGFYTDFEREFSSIYTLDGNHLLNEDKAQ